MIEPRVARRFSVYVRIIFVFTKPLASWSKNDCAMDGFENMTKKMNKGKPPFITEGALEVV